jgi:DNA-binding CsgD family transcriptional regulator
MEQIRTFILPASDGLRQDECLHKYEPQLSLLVESIEELQRGVGADLQVSMALTYSEWRVASLVKQGLTSEAIAEQLHIAPDTVKTHRRNIRRKLNLVGSKNRLRSHLQSVGGPHDAAISIEDFEVRGGSGFPAWYGQEGVIRQEGPGIPSTRDGSYGARRLRAPGR